MAVFPEGTVGDGGRLLPFKPSLLSAVAPPPEGVVIRPVAIDYGAAAPVIGWGTGEPGLKNFFRVLGRKGRMPVTIHVLGAIYVELRKMGFAVELVDDALAHVECVIVSAYPEGDHTIFVGRVERARAGGGDPLLYFRGQYQRLAPTSPGA